jgi:hypothetical protein
MIRSRLDKVPDKFFAQTYTGYETINRIATLEQAASYIVCVSLLRILKDQPLHHFKGGPESQLYFNANANPSELSQWRR